MLLALCLVGGYISTLHKSQIRQQRHAIQAVDGSFCFDSNKLHVSEGFKGKSAECIFGVLRNIIM